MFFDLFSRATRVLPSANDNNDNDNDMEDERAPQSAIVTRKPARRTEFGSEGCNVYGYPSSGGILVKEADILDLLYLDLSRSQACERSTDPNKEDRFCDSLRRIGAKWWISKHDWIMATLGARDLTEEESKVVVFGWPAEGAGVWVLRYDSERDDPDDFGRLRLALTMEERIAMMREYGAEFVEDVSQVPDLRDRYSHWSHRNNASRQSLSMSWYLPALQGCGIWDTANVPSHICATVAEEREAFCRLTCAKQATSAQHSTARCSTRIGQ